MWNLLVRLIWKTHQACDSAMSSCRDLLIIAFDPRLCMQTHTHTKKQLCNPSHTIYIFIAYVGASVLIIVLLCFWFVTPFPLINVVFWSHFWFFTVKSILRGKKGTKYCFLKFSKFFHRNCNCKDLIFVVCLILLPILCMIVVFCIPNICVGIT